MQLGHVLGEEVNGDGLVAVRRVGVVVPAGQLRGRVTGKVLLVRIVKWIAILCVTPVLEKIVNL